MLAKDYVLDDRLKPYRPGRDGPFGSAEVAHLLGRTELGATPARARAIEALGLRDAVRDILSFDDGQESSLYRRHLKLGPRIARRQELNLLQAQWFQRMLSAQKPMREHLTLFWHDHFATAHFKVKDTVALHDQNEILRGLAAGSFDQLLSSIARDPAMLTWLDNDSNTKVSPNENFARELFELFSLGLGAFGEEDVKEAARAFTGWGVKKGRFHFDASLHDQREKTILREKRAFRGEQVLGLIAESERSSRFLATKLFSWFVRPYPDEKLQCALTNLFATSDRHIGQFLEQLFQSRVFFAAETKGVLIRSPVQLVVAALRTMNATANAIELAEHCKRMGQKLYDPPSVEGWKGGRSWIDSKTLIARQNFGQALRRGPDDPLKTRSSLKLSDLKSWAPKILCAGHELAGEGASNSSAFIGNHLFSSRVHLF